MNESHIGLLSTGSASTMVSSELSYDTYPQQLHPLQ